jgi:tripartite-type tricarboxylate transporter receptor subunit TctC
VCVAIKLRQVEEMQLKLAALVLGIVLALVLSRSSLADTYPSHQITVLVPSGPGGMDTMVRLIAPEVSEEIGQPLVIENRPGANGLIGMRAVMRAPADGYTLIFATISIMVINPYIYKDVPYNSVEDFKPISRYASFPFVFAANPMKGFTSLADMAKFAHDSPNSLTLGNPGVGSAGYLLQEAFLRKNNLAGLIVPFKSAPQANLGAIQGTVDITVDNASSLSGAFSDGRLTPLAVTSAERSQSLTSVPSWLESGLGPFPSSAWYVFLAPKDTPDEVVSKLNGAFNRALALPHIQERIKALGGSFQPLSPAGTRAFIADELKQYGGVVREIGLKPE